MLSILFFIFCMSPVSGFNIPAIVDKDTGAILINAFVETNEQYKAKCGEFKLLIHMYSTVTCLANDLTTYTRVRKIYIQASAKKCLIGILTF